MMRGNHKYYLLVALKKDGSSSPRIAGAMISGEDHGSVTTDFSRTQWATLITIEAGSYAEAAKLILDEFVNRDNSYDAWLRPWFCECGCSDRYLKSLGIESRDDCYC